MHRDPRACIGPPRSLALRVLAITMLLLAPRLARADKIDDLVNDLDNDSDRVRLTAVLALTNQLAPRSIPGLVKRLLDSGEKKNIRGLAANALGKVIGGGNPSAAQKKQAIDALTKAKNDPEPFVSAKADAALADLGTSSGPATPSHGGPGGVYVNVGPMSSRTNSPADPTYRSSMEKTAKSTLGRIAPTYQQTWSGGGTPTKAQLAQKKIAGFYVDGTLNTVTITKSGNSAEVSCKVSMLLADFPDKSVFGLLNGGAKVQGSASQKDIELSTQDCVQAVMESLITKQIVPTIKTKI
ncbi:MAG: HEAT repeat domain-containing protein [Deltaproteobacteria bacterium]|nr:HEAT repeat domain-containing protein [Deltaproteobacteria bacterium]